MFFHKKPKTYFFHENAYDSDGDWSATYLSKYIYIQNKLKKSLIQNKQKTFFIFSTGHRLIFQINKNFIFFQSFFYLFLKFMGNIYYVVIIKMTRINQSLLLN